MAKVELKQPIVQEISDNIKDAQSVVVVNYRGLTVAQDTELRKALREAGVTYKVYKNTLVSRAVDGTDFAALKDVLEGPNAFAISTTDATAPARILSKFAKLKYQYPHSSITKLISCQQRNVSHPPKLKSGWKAVNGLTVGM